MLNGGKYFVGVHFLNYLTTFGETLGLLQIFNFRAFDVEMLYIAQKLGFLISEVAVNWTEIEGSKITPFWSWLEMGRDLCLIWFRYAIGAWAICKKPVETKKAK